MSYVTANVPSQKKLPRIIATKRSKKHQNSAPILNIFTTYFKFFQPNLEIIVLSRLPTIRYCCQRIG